MNPTQKKIDSQPSKSSDNDWIKEIIEYARLFVSGDDNALVMKLVLYFVSERICLFYPSVAQKLRSGSSDFDLMQLEIYYWHCTDVVMFLMDEADSDQSVSVQERISFMVMSRDSAGLRMLADFIDKTEDGKSGITHNAFAMAASRGRKFESKREFKKHLLTLAPSCCPPEGDMRGWTLLYKAAGLQGLPKGSPKRGASRHGG